MSFQGPLRGRQFESAQQLQEALKTLDFKAFYCDFGADQNVGQLIGSHCDPHAERTGKV